MGGIGGGGLQVQGGVEGGERLVWLGQALVHFAQLEPDAGFPWRQVLRSPHNPFEVALQVASSGMLAASYTG